MHHCQCVENGALCYADDGSGVAECFCGPEGSCSVRRSKSAADILERHNSWSPDYDEYSNLFADDLDDELFHVYGETPTYALVLKASEDNDFDWNHGVCLYADSFDGAEPELSPVTTLEGGIEQVRVVEALLNSAKTGKEVVL